MTRSIGRKLAFMQDRCVSDLLSSVEQGWDERDRALLLVTLLGCLSYTISGPELEGYASFANIDLSNEFVADEIARGYKARVLFLAEDEKTRPFIERELYVDEIWHEVARDMQQFRQRFFSSDQSKGLVKKDVNIAKASCPKCGRFEVKNSDDVEIHYVKYSAIPRCKVVCPQCNKRIVSKFDKTTAILFEDLGVKATHWTDNKDEITEDEVDNFMTNFDSEIEALLL